MMGKLLNIIKRPRLFLLYIMKFRVFRLVPDALYLKLKYRLAMGKKLDLVNPKSFNEKLQWLKLYDRNQHYTRLVDKYEVREYISKTIGDEYLIPLLGVYDSFDEINFDNLPNQFVLKCTHDSGGLIICKDKSNFDKKAAEKRINKYLRTNYYWSKREWPYKNISPKIICEKFMVDKSESELKDYKFFCFNGEPKAMFVASDRGVDTRFDFFDLDFNHLPFEQHYKNAKKKINRPINFEKMIKLAKVLSKEIPHVRIDFYDVNGKIFFGELTFYHFSGFEKFEPDKYDEVFGSWISLP